MSGLYLCEYRPVFSGQPRLILFNCPENIDPDFIANGMKGSGEYVYNLENATQAMGLFTQYVDVSVKPRRVIGNRRARYRYFKK